MLLDNALDMVLPVWDAAALGAGGIGYLTYKGRQKRKPTPQWKVKVASPKELVELNDTYYYCDQKRINRNQALVVRLEKDGNVLEIGTVDASAEDVEEAIDSLVAQAQNKAESLNARM